MFNLLVFPSYIFYKVYQSSLELLSRNSLHYDGGVNYVSAYPACFIKEDTGYSVIFPDLNTATCGDDLEDAFSMAVDCLAGYLYSSNLEGENVPPASVLQDIDIQKIMDELEVTSNEAFVNIVTVDIAEYYS